MIDLTDSPDEEAIRPSGRARQSRPSNEPIGVNLTVDMVDLIDSDDNEDVAISPRVMVMGRQPPQQQPAKQTHPIKVMLASKKRKLEREAARREKEKQQRLEEARKKKELEDEERRRNSVNFVIIDDSSDEEQEEAEPNEVTHGGTGHENISWWRTSPRKRRRASRNIKRSTESESRNPQFHSVFFNYHMTNDDAAQLQERMLQEAAARVRASVTNNNQVNGDGVPVFKQPMLQVADEFPDHWLWKDPYSCLGLPPDATVTSIKAHYRALARLYHPDKSKQPNTARKFQGIARAYRKLIDRSNHLD